MKLKTTLFIIAAAIGLQANAQSWVTDSVEMGAQYSKDVFYSLGTGNDATANASNWDIAFQINKFGDPSFNASVRANHIKNDVQVYSLHLQASTKFGNLSASDTVGLTDPSMQLLNNDTSWGTGAFTNNRGGNQFDFGWGKYVGPPTHSVVGDSLYLVIVNGTPYQLWIEKYISMGTNAQLGYTFKVAKFDNSNSRLDSVKRVTPFEDRLFAYYTISSGTVTDREPARKDWDILFTQYQKNGQPDGQNTKKLQAYTGVLSNLRVEVAKITSVSPNTINAGNYSTYTSSMSLETNAIGDDWKTFNMSTFKYELDTNTSFIVKPDTAFHSLAYHHIRFTRFEGGATGKIVFDKRVLYALSVNDTKGAFAANYSIYPNPAQNQVNVMIDAKTAKKNTVLAVMDITGKVLQQTSVQLKEGVNAYSFDMSNYPAGTYVVSVMNDSWHVSDKVVVQH